MKALFILLLFITQLVFGQEIPKANLLVLEYAEKNVGKRVGNGICRTLTNRALRYKDAELNPKKPKLIEYSIGKAGKRVSVEETLPGDIILFRGTLILYEDNVWGKCDAHIGIVKSYENGIISIYEQNAISEKEITIIHSRVVESAFKVKNIKRGSIKIIRPKNPVNALAIK